MKKNISDDITYKKIYHLFVNVIKSAERARSVISYLLLTIKTGSNLLCIRDNIKSTYNDIIKKYLSKDIHIDVDTLIVDKVVNIIIKNEKIDSTKKEVWGNISNILGLSEEIKEKLDSYLSDEKIIKNIVADLYNIDYRIPGKILKRAIESSKKIEEVEQEIVAIWVRDEKNSVLLSRISVIHYIIAASIDCTEFSISILDTLKNFLASTGIDIEEYEKYYEKIKSADTKEYDKRIFGKKIGADKDFEEEVKRLLGSIMPPGRADKIFYKKESKEGLDKDDTDQKQKDEGKVVKSRSRSVLEKLLAGIDSVAPQLDLFGKYKEIYEKYTDIKKTITTKKDKKEDKKEGKTISSETKVYFRPTNRTKKESGTTRTPEVPDKKAVEENQEGGSSASTRDVREKSSNVFFDFISSIKRKISEIKPGDADTQKSYEQEQVNALYDSLHNIKTVISEKENEANTKYKALTYNTKRLAKVLESITSMAATSSVSNASGVSGGNMTPPVQSTAATTSAQSAASGVSQTGMGSIGIRQTRKQQAQSSSTGNKKTYGQKPLANLLSKINNSTSNQYQTPASTGKSNQASQFGGLSVLSKLMKQTPQAQIPTKTKDQTVDALMQVKSQNNKQTGMSYISKKNRANAGNIKALSNLLNANLISIKYIDDTIQQQGKIDKIQDKQNKAQQTIEKREAKLEEKGQIESLKSDIKKKRGLISRVIQKKKLSEMFSGAKDGVMMSLNLLPMITQAAVSAGKFVLTLFTLKTSLLPDVEMQDSYKKSLTEDERKEIEKEQADLYDDEATLRKRSESIIVTQVAGDEARGNLSSFIYGQVTAKNINSVGTNVGNKIKQTYTAARYEDIKQDNNYQMISMQRMKIEKIKKDTEELIQYTIALRQKMAQTAKDQIELQKAVRRKKQEAASLETGANYFEHIVQ